MPYKPTGRPRGRPPKIPEFGTVATLAVKSPVVSPVQNRPLGPKTRVLKRNRIRQIYILLLNGADHAQIAQYAEREGWGYTKKALEHAIHEATSIFEEHAERSFAEEFGKAIARLQSWMMKCVEQGDLALALKMQKELSETLGLKAPLKHEYSGGVQIAYRDPTNPVPALPATSAYVTVESVE